MKRRNEYIERFVRVMKVDNSWIENLPPQGLATLQLLLGALRQMPPAQRREKYEEVLRGMATKFVDGVIEDGWSDKELETAVILMEQGAGL